MTVEKEGISAMSGMRISMRCLRDYSLSKFTSKTQDSPAGGLNHGADQEFLFAGTFQQLQYLYGEINSSWLSKFHSRCDILLHHLLLQICSMCRKKSFCCNICSRAFAFLFFSSFKLYKRIYLEVYINQGQCLVSTLVKLSILAGLVH